MHKRAAFWLGTPCVTLRDNTEWRETMELEMNVLTGADPERINGAVNGFKKHMKTVMENPYDFGGASEKIIEALTNRY